MVTASDFSYRRAGAVLLIAAAAAIALHFGLAEAVDTCTVAWDGGAGTVNPIL